MKTLLTTSIIFLLSYTSFSQDRGCIGSSENLQISTEDSLYYSQYQESRECWYFDYFANDTVFIQIAGSDGCTISWDAFDNWDAHYYSSIRWYKDAEVMEPNLYEFNSADANPNGCYTGSTHMTALTTNKSGVYKFVLGYEQYTTMYFKIEYLEDSDIDTIAAVLTSPIINFYPNPANSSLTINHGLIENGEYTFYDLQGRMIYKEILNSDGNQTRINLNDFSNGTYLIQVTTDVHGILTEKIIIQK